MERALGVSAPPLLAQFPELTPHFPWTELLATRPTPVVFLPNQQLWVKRDDLACPRYGGNKARKLEWVLGAIQQRGQRALLTVGGLCSNHCTAVAIYGAAMGLRTALYFTPTPLQPGEEAELDLQARLGAEQNRLGLRTLPRLLARCADPRWAVIPPAGSTVEGVLGYVDAGLELAAQIAAGALPLPRTIYIAAATGGTATGLAMGLALAALDPLPQVVAVETVTPAWQRARFLLPSAPRLLARLRQLSPAARARLPHTCAGLTLERRFGFDREPLGIVPPAVQAALAEADSLGLPLDPHFSARAWAALQADRAAGRVPDGPTLFWNTHGQPA